MTLKNNFKLPNLLLRIAIATPYLWFVADRLGWLGEHGTPHVGWGDWEHFIRYARETMIFLPESMVAPLAFLATAGELIFGLLLLVGFKTRLSAIGSCCLSLLFALSMAMSFGIESPLAYSVFTLSASSLLLATIPEYNFSIDKYIQNRSPQK